MKNEQLEQTISELKTKAIKDKKPFFKRIASDLEKPRKTFRTVNVERILKNIKEGEVAVVPGKVIGDLKTNCEIYAYNWSANVGKNNNIKSLKDLMKKTPARCRIIG